MTALMLLDRLNQDLKNAMKQGQPATTAVLRMLLSSLKNEKISKQQDLTEEEVMAVMSREVKKRRDSVTAYTQGARQDLADKELAEIGILQVYLPEQLSEEQVRAEVKVVLEANPGAPFGKIMGQAMAKLKGRADGNLVQKIVKETVS